MEKEMSQPPQRNQDEKLWSPSEWSKRFGPDEVIEEHIRIITLQSRCNRVDIPANLNVSYRESKLKFSNNEVDKKDSVTKFEGTKLDIFGTDLEKTSPIFVYFSGGYWQLLCGELSSYPAGPLHLNNIVSIIVDYDRAPKVTLDEIVEEAIDAMDWIVKYAVRNNSRSISICGHSAGAQLCAMILASTWFSQLPSEHKNLFRGIFLMAGVYDLRPLIPTYVNEPLDLSSEDAERNSPMLLANNIADNLLMRTSTSTLYVDMIVGENDSPAFKEQNQNFAEEIKNHLERKVPEGTSDHGINITTTILPEVDHFNLVENLRNISYEIVQRILHVVNG